MNEGEIFAYPGPNGAGKTTTINILTILLTPTSGKATVGSYDVTKDGKEVGRLLGYLLEDFGPYLSLAVYENLDFAAGLYRMKKMKEKIRVENYLSSVEFDSYKNARILNNA